MRKVNLGLVQMAMGADSQKNVDKAIRMVSSASDKGANVVCLPELFTSRYFPRTSKSKEEPTAIPNDTTERLSATARENGVVVVGGSIFEKSGGKSFNTSVVFDERGKVLGKYRKIHLPRDPGFYEQDYFSAGDRYLVVRTTFGRLGVLICFDQWYPEPARTLKLMGAEIVLYPTAIGTLKGVEQSEGDWRAAWEAVQRGHAVSNSVVVATANRTGVENSLDFWGGSFVYDQFGTLVARADGGEEVLMATVDLDLAKEVEKGWGFLRNRKPETYGKLAK